MRGAIELCFGHLALVHLLFEGAGGQEPVHDTRFLLALPPHSPHGLLVHRWVPVAVEEH